MRLIRSLTLPHRLLLAALTFCAPCLAVEAVPQDKGRPIELGANRVRDKIQGGLLGQLLGNLNGLKYEFKFDKEPGNVERYVPALPGARTDDDTDIEWVYVIEMQRSERLLIPYERIMELWQAHINRKLWVANRWARALMELGVHPPLTGHPRFNPKSHYNISGQFVCETFGLIAPGMPQAAARIGLHYTRVTIDGEPAQATQLFTSMIATAFLTGNMDEILDAGLASVDPRSQIHEIVSTTRAWCRQYPRDWRTPRRLIKERYTQYPGGGNGYGLITASTVAALLYGQGDFTETLRLAFNFGWDADNTAATAGTIVGVIRGRQWMEAQGWQIGDAYLNTTRDGMPNDETITKFGNRLVALAECAIIQEGGKVITADGQRTYRIRTQRPANIEPLTDPVASARLLQSKMEPQLASDIASNDEKRRIRGIAIVACLGLGDTFSERYPEQMQRALADLKTKLESISKQRTEEGGPNAVAKGVKPLREYLLNRLHRTKE